MCCECGNVPCLTGCPNARERARAGTCTDCAQPIYSGEEVVDIDGDLYHLERIERMSTTELLALMADAADDVIIGYYNMETADKAKAAMHILSDATIEMVAANIDRLLDELNDLPDTEEN